MQYNMCNGMDLKYQGILIYLNVLDVEKLSGDEIIEVQEYVRNKIYCKSSTGK